MENKRQQTSHPPTVDNKSLFFSRPNKKARISKLLFRYLGTQCLFFFLFCLLGFGFLFFFLDMIDELSSFIEANTKWTKAVAYFLHRQPAHLKHVLPMSLLLALSYVFNKLARHHEITAVRASGISMFQFCLPVWCLGLVAGLLLFWLNEEVVIRHENLADNIQAEINTGIQDDTEKKKKARLAFRNHTENRYWFIENFNRTGGQEGVSLKQHDQKTNELTWEIRSEKALYKDGKWFFIDGYRYTYEPGERLPASEKKFTQYTLHDLDETPSQIISHLNPAEEMNLRQILTLLRADTGLSGGTRIIFKTLAWHRAFIPLSCILAVLLGVGTGVGQGRAGALRGFASAMGLMALYYIANQVFLVLGKYGLLPAWIAALPPVGFTAYGLWLVYRHR